MLTELQKTLDNENVKLLKLRPIKKSYIIEIDHDYLRVLAKHVSGCSQWTKEEKERMDDLTGWLCECMIETPLDWE